MWCCVRPYPHRDLQGIVAEPEETDDLLRLGLHRLPPREFPHMRTLAGELARYDGAAELITASTPC